MSDNENLQYRIDGNVAVITLNRPKVFNALNTALISAWEDAIKQANADDNVASILVTGEGKAFCAGADMEGWFLPYVRGDQPYREDDQRLGGLGPIDDWVKLVRESKPLVAAVNGVAVGGGITMLLPFDVIYASSRASFMFPFIKVGIVPEYCSSHFLAARVGFARASEWMLSGRSVAADEAERAGLVNRVLEPEALVPEALKVAKSLAKAPAPMLKMTKKLLSKNFAETDINQVWQRESDALRQCFSSQEHRDAVDAFLGSKK